MVITSIGDYCLSPKPKEKPVKVGYIINAEYRAPVSTHELTIGVLFDNTIKFVEEIAYGAWWEWDLNNLSEKEKKIIDEIMILYKNVHN